MLRPDAFRGPVVGLSLLPVAVLLGGCMVGPDYVEPEVAMPDQWLDWQQPDMQEADTDFSDWWTVFEDPILDDLVEAASDQNLSLQIAGLRILESRAILGIAIGNQWPQQQSLDADLSTNQVSANAANAAGIDRYYGDLSAGFSAVWEVDVWGKFRRAVQADLANFQASIADYDDIVVSLTAEVASVYFELRTAEERLSVARENAVIQERSLSITQAQFDAGEVSELDVAQARSLLRTTEASIPGFETDVRQARNALAILVGKYPGEIDALLSQASEIPDVPSSVIAGVPTQLIRRRPDIRFAERSLAAQSAEIGVAEADLYPAFSLIGSLGFQSANRTDVRSNNANFVNLFDGRSLFFSLGPSVSWNVLNYGRIKNQVRVQDARFQQLVVNYENTLLTAVGEVENAMVAFLRNQETVRLLEEAVASAKRSVELSELQYTKGLVDYQRVLDAQRSLSTQQDDLTFTVGQVGQSLIGVYRALGGGWQLREGRDFVNPDTRREMQERTDWGQLLEPAATDEEPLADPDAVLQPPDW